MVDKYQGRETQSLFSEPDFTTNKLTDMCQFSKNKDESTVGAQNRDLHLQVGELKTTSKNTKV